MNICMIRRQLPPEVLSISGYDCGVMELFSWRGDITYLELAVKGAPSTTIYLGRSDIGLSYGEGYTLSWDNSDPSLVEWIDPVFTDDDIGKVVPIWLSSNPPPY